MTVGRDRTRRLADVAPAELISGGSSSLTCNSYRVHPVGGAVPSAPSARSRAARASPSFDVGVAITRGDRSRQRLGPSRDVGYRRSTLISDADDRRRAAIIGSVASNSRLFGAPPQRDVAHAVGSCYLSREIHVERSRGPRFAERVHAVNRPDQRSAPGEPTRLLAAPRESLPTADAAEGWASGPPTRKLMTGAAS